MNRVFGDMDGVIVDFDEYVIRSGLDPKVLKLLPGSYRNMKPMEGALDAIDEIIDMGYDFWFASKPPTGAPDAYSDKVHWVMDHKPELTDKIILTHNKSLIGGVGDYLIDDRPHKAEAHNFPGNLLVFKPGFMWPEVLTVLRNNMRNL